MKVRPLPPIDDECFHFSVKEPIMETRGGVSLVETNGNFVQISTRLSKNPFPLDV